MLLFTILLSAWLLVLCVQDWRWRRLPNWLTLGGAAAGLAWRLGMGKGALLDGVAGGLLCAALLAIPFLLHAAGGGDVKMLFAVGCIFGSGHAMELLLCISLAGLVLAPVMILAGKASGGRLKHWLRCAFDWRYDRAAGRAVLPPRDDERYRVPFGIAIAAGTWVALGVFVWGGAG